MLLLQAGTYGQVGMAQGTCRVPPDTPVPWPSRGAATRCSYDLSRSNRSPWRWPAPSFPRISREPRGLARRGPGPTGRMDSRARAAAEVAHQDELRPAATPARRPVGGRHRLVLEDRLREAGGLHGLQQPCGRQLVRGVGALIRKCTARSTTARGGYRAEETASPLPAACFRKPPRSGRTRAKCLL